ncbi:MAG: PD-(D/E)XK nuclease family protein [Thermodesulfobacteriota bacterium]|nr:PD-(D/E)XK nuclease family protein [Thermodesulfobacteriota bacterium]
MVKIEKRILSPTAINTYLSCPRKFFLRYIKRLKTRPSIHLIRGHIVHKTLHRFHENRCRAPPQMAFCEIRQQLLTIFAEEWEKAEGSLNALGLSSGEIEFFRDDSEVMLLNFSQWFHRNGMASPDVSEARIVSHNLRLMGIIDAVHRQDGKLTLVDYKTSKYPKITEDIMRQAALYALLCQNRYKQIPETVLIHFLKFPDDPQPIHVDNELLEYARILVESVGNKTTSQEEDDYPCTCGGYCKKDFVTK